MIPISDILIRSISGYVFMVPVFVLYFLWLKKLGRTQSFLHTAAVFVFGYYLFGLLTVTGIGFTSTMTFRPNISWTPFIGMITGPIDTILNIILFVPLGFFLPLLYKKYHHMKTVALTGFLFSLAVEIVQMFGWGSSDINDLMTNTAGACIGFLGQHRTIAEASAVESPIRQETIGFPAHFFARAHNFKPPGRACQPEADSPMRT